MANSTRDIEEIVKQIKSFSQEQWIDVINKLMVNTVVKLPISMEKAIPEEVITELSNIMNDNAVDKSELEAAVIGILYSLRGDQVVPYKISTIINILGILRPPLYNHSIRELIIDRSFYNAYFRNRSIHLALINYYRSIIPIEDFKISELLKQLIEQSEDGNTLLVGLRYFKKFYKDINKFFDVFLRIIQNTASDKSRSMIMIFVEEWGRTETYKPLCNFIDLRLWSNRDDEYCRSFISLLKNFLARIQNDTDDIYCVQAYNFATLFLKQHVDAEAIDYLIKVDESRGKDLRSLVRLKTVLSAEQVKSMQHRIFVIEPVGHGKIEVLINRFDKIINEKIKHDLSIVNNFSDVSQYDKVMKAADKLMPQIMGPAYQGEIFYQF